MSSFVYYLARDPALQKRAREEVLAALGNEEPNMTNLRKMNFVQACIRESLRINTPIVSTLLANLHYDYPYDYSTHFPDLHGSSYI